MVSGRPTTEDFWTIEESAGVAHRYLDMAQDLTPSFPQSEEETRGMTASDDSQITWYTGTDAEGLTRRRNYWMSAVSGHPFSDEDSAADFLLLKIEKTEREMDETNWMAVKRRYNEEVELKKGLMGETELMLMTPHGGPGVDVLYSMLGWQQFSLLTHDRPELVKRFIDAQTLLDSTWVDKVIENADRQPVALIYCDIASTTGLMLSPEWIRENMYPNIERLAWQYREKGIRVIYHSEGNMAKVIDDLRSPGVEGINPLEKTVPGMSVPEVRSRWPDLVLWGGVDTKDLLVAGSVEDVR